ncbi:MAG TPA: MBL fold metallo-hydrolase [Candidatus Dormibacteraeota bacterium]|nr:MBL fold metallo-hydrolase [Candidatus Dormibacteraeota bacterium]
MACHICATCGTQFAASIDPPAACPICEDERQYVGWSGQKWTTLDSLRGGHRNLIRDDLGVTGIGTEPSFAIGQRALLVSSPGGNLLWDCITLLDDATLDAVRSLGGLRGIAISHPHYYTSMVEWSHAFDAPVFLHEADRRWVMRPDPSIELWSGDTRALWDGMTLINAGGHFDGGTVLHWPGGNTLLGGDIVQVAQDRRWVSFMYSFPNYIPLPAVSVKRIVAALEPFAFDRIYGAWWDRNVASDGKEAVRRSAERYKRAILSTEVEGRPPARQRR